MKTLAFFSLCTMLFAFQTQALGVRDTTTFDSDPTGHYIVCTVNNNATTFYSVGTESSTVSCTCTEIFTTPNVKVISNPTTHTILVKGALEGDLIYILNNEGKALMTLEASENDPRIDVSSLSPGTYTIGVQPN